MAPSAAGLFFAKASSAAAAVTPLPRVSSARCQSPSTRCQSPSTHSQNPSTPSSLSPGRLSASWNQRVVGISAQRPLRMANAGRNARVTSNTLSRCSASSSATTTNTTPSEDVLRIWQTADAVCFDVDSTVCVDEGIDELAAYCGAGEAVAAWTTKAMSGSVPFETALAARLEIFNPSAADVAGFLRDHPPR
ncbi:hypothetical protein CLOM_g6792 [Closterium sp. NIES-68]|nr:hypothetical protein CLOM_g6792 [Closterium sp. NIES-68]